MATTGSEYWKNPKGKWKVRISRNKVKQKGHQNSSTLGPYELEEAKFLPNNENLEENLSEVKLKYENLSNELLKKSGISAKEMSKGMKQLYLMMEKIFFLNYQMQEEGKCSSLEESWKESCDLPSGWMKQENQQDFKKEMVISLDEHSSLEDGWTESCNLPSGWMKQDNQQNLHLPRL